jgi:hypothetical protein
MNYRIDANGGTAPDPEKLLAGWVAFVKDATNQDFDANELGQWTNDRLESVTAKLRQTFPPGEE